MVHENPSGGINKTDKSTEKPLQVLSRVSRSTRTLATRLAAVSDTVDRSSLQLLGLGTRVRSRVFVRTHKETSTDADPASEVIGPPAPAARTGIQQPVLHVDESGINAASAGKVVKTDVVLPDSDGLTARDGVPGREETQKPGKTLSTKHATVDDSIYKEMESRLQGMSPYDRRELIDGARAVETRLVNFWNMLVDEVNKTGYEIPQDSKTTILDIGCGICEEAPVLNAFFGGNEYNVVTDSVQLIGVDNDLEQIDYARRYHGAQPYEFYHGDARNLDEIPQVPSLVDGVVIRHEQIGTDQEAWTSIYENAYARLRDGGIMIITSFFDSEHQKTVAALESMGCKVVLDKRNSDSTVYDKCVVIVKK
ncbi:MAG TPA: class I SAM-dependent methyltransferase [Candidatus Acidoferrales bacterium]|nr:class I SAM-dependent methyltransferase [Candidatus Acidoferrales bacterium]